MNSYLFSILSAILFVTGVSAQQMVCNTPTNVLSCTPVQITWSGGQAPYTLSVHDGTNPSGPALLTFTNLTGGSYTWSSVTFAPNTLLDLSLRDNTGLISQTAVFTVQTGSTSCLNGTTTAPSTVVASTPASGATTNANTPATTGTTGTTNQNKPTSSASGSGSSSSPKSSGNAAMSNDISYGMAGVLGAVVAAIFV